MFSSEMILEILLSNGLSADTTRYFPGLHGNPGYAHTHTSMLDDAGLLYDKVKRCSFLIAAVC